MIDVIRDVIQIPVMPRNSINCYIIEDVLIDSGVRSSHAIIFKAAKRRPIQTHVLTHAHADHQGSSKVVCETLQVPLWCSAQEKPEAESGNATKHYSSQNHLITKFQKRYWAGEGYPVSKTLCEGDKVGGFTVIETPGHSKGHLSFFRESDGVLIVGDVLMNMNLFTTVVGLHQPPDLFTLDREQNIKSINKLASLKPAILCFGHGPVLTNGTAFQNFVRKANFS